MSLTVLSAITPRNIVSKKRGPLSANRRLLFNGQRRACCGRQTLDTERTEHLRDLRVKSLGGTEAAENVVLLCPKVRATTKFVTGSWQIAAASLPIGRLAFSWLRRYDRR